MLRLLYGLINVARACVSSSTGCADGPGVLLLGKALCCGVLWMVQLALQVCPEQSCCTFLGFGMLQAEPLAPAFVPVLHDGLKLVVYFDRWCSPHTAPVCCRGLGW